MQHHLVANGYLAVNGDARVQDAVVADSHAIAHHGTRAD